MIDHPFRDVRAYYRMQRVDFPAKAREYRLWHRAHVPPRWWSIRWAFSIAWTAFQYRRWLKNDLKRGSL